MSLRHPTRLASRRVLVIAALALLGAGLAVSTTAMADSSPATSSPWEAAAKKDGFLPPDQAFRVSASADGASRVRIDYVIAPGYYLYQSRLKFATTSPGVTLGKPELPAGDTKQDEYFGKQIVYHSAFVARLGVTRAASASANVALAVTYQGCAEAGLCYPPITKPFTVTLAPKAVKGVGVGAAGASSAGGGGRSASAGGAAGTTAFVSDQDRLARMIRTGGLSAVIATFFGLGLLLAFTPCVLPMVPILSGLIAGQGSKVTTGRAFSLSLTYVLGMAITYTIAGAAFAAAGHQVQAVFQQPWIVLLFAALFIALALSMFGVYTLQMPAAIQTRLSESSNRAQAGTLGGVAIMGALSALIVTACVAPALVGALLVISQGGDVVRGAVALFAMSLGMGTPLLVIGTSAGKLLPKAGPWMDTIKQLFGAMMLGVAAWMLARLVNDRYALLLYAVPLVAAFVVLWRVRGGGGARLLGRAAAAAAGVYAVLLGVGAARGATDPLRPLSLPAPAQAQASEASFVRVGSLAELDRAVTAASAQGRAVMLDFYADWCTSCKEMERYTFTNPQVRQALSHLTLLRADVTANNADDQAMLKRFGIFGPPTIAFYGGDGRERARYRVVGYMPAGAFADVLRRATAPGS